jgi:ankyrin repeat protein
LGFLESTAKTSASGQAIILHIDETRMIDIHLAAYFVLEESISALLDKNVNVESVDDSGQTSLSWAAGNGHEGVAKLLLDKNADIESKVNIYSQTPLSWAAKNGHEAVVKLLLDKNADVESKNLTRAAHAVP